MSRIRLKDLLGKGMWEAKYDGYSTSGVGSPWNDRAASAWELLQQTRASQREDPLYFVWLEYQKLGRSIKRVEVERKHPRPWEELGETEEEYIHKGKQLVADVVLDTLIANGTIEQTFENGEEYLRLNQ